MSYEQNMLSKGVYSNTQLRDFVSVKNYIFLRHDGKKCLLLRFSNDSEAAIDAMSYTVTQMDMKGTVLEKTRVSEQTHGFLPGNVHAAEKALVVREDCHDFRVSFHEARSGRYLYTVRNGRITVTYLRREPKAAEIPPADDSVYEEEGFSIRPSVKERPRAAKRMACLTLLLLVILNLGLLISPYVREWYEEEKLRREEKKAREEYEETLRTHGGQGTVQWETIAFDGKFEYDGSFDTVTQPGTENTVPSFKPIQPIGTEPIYEEFKPGGWGGVYHND